MSTKDYAFKVWVLENYVLKNPRFIAIKNRMDACHSYESNSAVLGNRFFSMKKELMKIYMNDPEIKKKYKVHLAIRKMLENVGNIVKEA